MKSIVFEFINQEGESHFSIGSYDYFKQKIKTEIQLIRTLGLEYSEDDWKYLCDLTQEELRYVLEKMFRDNPLKVEHPN